MGKRVRVVDDFSTGSRDNLDGLLDRVELIEGTVTDAETVRQAVRGPRAVAPQAQATANVGGGETAEGMRGRGSGQPIRCPYYVSRCRGE